MSRARHHMKHKAHGGEVKPVNGGGDPHVMHDAEEKKKGGRVKKHLAMHGKKPHHRLDRGGRKRGGRVGADMAPLSSAHNPD